MQRFLPVVALLSAALVSTAVHPDHKDNIEKVKRYFANQARSGAGGARWEAGENHLTEKDPEDLKDLCGTVKPTRSQARSNYHPPARVPNFSKQRIQIDTTFDAASRWQNCPSIKQVRDQGGCGSCWAFAGAETLSDRYCIASGQTKTKTFSVQDMLICSGGQNVNYCGGNLARAAYTMAVSTGVVSGGDYNSGVGCLPYTSYSGAAVTATSTAQCANATCISGYGKTYAQDKSYATVWYELGSYYANNNLSAGGAAASIKNESVVRQIQYELMTNGPLTVQIKVYNDFFTYKSGVYQHITGDYAGGHGMKLIGWGTEGGVDYWLVVNSWGYGWGLNGTVKILRGVNHLGIEDYLVTALVDPNLTQPVASAACNLAGCAGRSQYAMAPANVCSTNFCACYYYTGVWNAAKNGYDWQQSPQVISCPATPTAQAFDASGSVQACVDKTKIPACAASG
ncbi:cathepsin B-like [Paramacrobiotus metropolitanus]|uniref:cathepsin B-like n=1 Tax=Paramacrobiotus metropolitanus TaxID=2943436 RepID=UPI0024465778|nr:cathepsin B-like [Paramacrobiotus metropolitanus]